jgi:hypothetical protein
VAYDDRGEPLWRQWAPWRVDPWQSVESWADLHRTDYFGEAFNGFMCLWGDEGWRGVLSTAVHWYVEANRNASGLEAGVVFTQMALELVAWHYLTQHKKAMTKDGFHRLTAADRLRLVLSEHEIPLELPSALPDLKFWAGEFNWCDAAEAITNVRNNVVHPEAGHRDKLEASNKNPTRDAWVCGLWLLELLLLRMFGYTGNYSDRREEGKFVGSTKPVPWAEWVDEVCGGSDEAPDERENSEP